MKTGPHKVLDERARAGDQRSELHAPAHERAVLCRLHDHLADVIAERRALLEHVLEAFARLPAGDVLFHHKAHPTDRANGAYAVGFRGSGSAAHHLAHRHPARHALMVAKHGPHSRRRGRNVLLELDPAHRRALLPLALRGIDYLGNASTIPPSTGSVAPVVGVWLLAKKTTALPTCRALTRVRSKLRSR